MKNQTTVNDCSDNGSSALFRLGLTALGLAALGLAAAPVARSGVWDEETRMVLVKVMVGEAGYDLAVDHPAMVGVLTRRNELPFWRGKSIREVAMSYSMVVKEGLPPNENRLRAARVTRDSAPAAIMRMIDAVGDGTPLAPCRRPWESGMLCDPCRGQAMHWGSVQDAHASPLATIACGRTRNVFLGTTRPVRRRPMTIPINGVLPAREAY